MNGADLLCEGHETRAFCIRDPQDRSRIRAVPVPLRFAPWQKPDILAKLAPGYPRLPIADLAAGREGALAAYRKTGD